MMSGRKPTQGRIRRLIHAPVIGELLYRLNVSRPVVRMMYRRHVFADPAFLTEHLLAARMRVARRPGARFAWVCFVTGALDPFNERAAFLAAARRVQRPTLMLYGPDTPPKSRAGRCRPRLPRQAPPAGSLRVAFERQVMEIPAGGGCQAAFCSHERRWYAGDGMQVASPAESVEAASVRGN
jgi:hypothetical protein